MSIALTVALFIVAVVAGSVLAYVLAQRAFQRSLSDLEDRTGRQLGRVLDVVKKLETELARLSESSVAAAQVSAPRAPTMPAEESRDKKAQEITPDTLAVLAAAVTAFLGKKVRIRSAKMLQSPYEIVNPWAQQGRVIVQASHNLRPRS